MTAVNRFETSEGSKFYVCFMHASVFIGAIWQVVQPYNWLIVIPIYVIPLIMWMARFQDPFIHNHGKGLFIFVIVWFLILPFIMYTGLGIYVSAVLGATELDRYTNLADQDMNPIGISINTANRLSYSGYDFAYYIIMFGTWFLYMVPILNPLYTIYFAIRGRSFKGK